MSFRNGSARDCRIGADPAGRGRTATALVALPTLLALAGAAPSRADAPAGGDDDVRDETLLEEEFTPLDLFEGLRNLRPRVRLVQNATLAQDFGPVEVDQYETGLGASIAAPLSSELAVRVVGEVRGTQFDFDGDQSFLDTNRPGDPFDPLLSTKLRIEGRYQILDDWAIVGGTEVESSFEEGSAFERGMQEAGYVGAAHLFRERFSVLAGFQVRSRLGRGGASVTPIVQLGWRVTDDIEIETQGMGLNVAVRVDDTLTLFARGGLRNKAYRLGDRGGAIGRGILRNRSLPLELGARWRLGERWRVRLAAGAMLYQRYAVYDHDDQFVHSSSSRRPAFTGDLGLEYRF